MPVLAVLPVRSAYILICCERIYVSPDFWTCHDDFRPISTMLRFPVTDNDFE